MGSHKSKKEKRECKLRRRLLAEMENRRLLKRVSLLERYIAAPMSASPLEGNAAPPPTSGDTDDDGITTPPLPYPEVTSVPAGASAPTVIRRSGAVGASAPPSSDAAPLVALGAGRPLQRASSVHCEASPFPNQFLQPTSNPSGFPPTPQSNTINQSAAKVSSGKESLKSWERIPMLHTRTFLKSLDLIYRSYKLHRVLYHL